jgi:hypothetical protein
MISAVLTGGDSHAFERNKYKIIVTRPGSNVTTQLRVYAEDLEEARENVALNGWQIISIEDMSNPAAPVSGMMRGDSGSEGTADSYSVSISKIGDGAVEPEGMVKADAGTSLTLIFKPGACDKIGKILVNNNEVILDSPDYTINDIKQNIAVVAVFEKNGGKCGENGIFSADLTELLAEYFDLGKFSKDISAETAEMIKALPLDKKYAVIGHTDDVRVIPNEEFADNFQLSVKRAEFLKSRLVSAGVKPENITVIGLGPAFPAAPNKKEGQPQNRRAVVYERR